MKFTPRFLKRDFTAPVLVPAGEYTIKRYSWQAVGGPQEAEIEIRGDPKTLMQWFDLMRTPVEIFNEEGQAVWWGFVGEARVSFDDIDLGVSMNGMANRVKVNYSTGGTSSETEWISDDDSDAIYGRIERVETLSDVSAATATQRRDTILEALRAPLSLPLTQSNREVNARLICRGWWSTLDWKYHEHSTLLTSHWIQQGQNFSSFMSVGTFGGDQYDVTSIAQVITITGDEPYLADQVSIYISSTTTPYNIKLIEYAPNRPVGAALTTATIPVGNHYGFATASFSPRITITPTERYWFVIDAATIGWHIWGEILMDERPPTLRSIDWKYLYGYWEQHSPYSSIVYKITGVQDQSDILKYIAEDADFITAVDIVNVAGLYSDALREGTSKQLQEIEALLKAGTVNDRRLLAYITRERVLRVYEEPARSRNNVTLYMDTKKRFYNTAGQPTLDCPVARWCLLRNIPSAPNTSIDPTLFFIERAEFNCNANQWTIEPRGMDTPWQLGAIR